MEGSASTRTMFDNNTEVREAMPKKPKPDEAATSGPASKKLQQRWSVSLDANTLNRPGGLLMAALVAKASERGHSIPEMAENLSYSYPYINLLMSGLRRVDQVSDDFTDKAAAYLQVPRVVVLMLASRITPADYFEIGTFTAALIEPAMRFISEDQKWGPLLTGEMRNGSLDTKYGIIKLYEAATGKKLLDSELDVSQLATEIQRMKALAAVVEQA